MHSNILYFVLISTSHDLNRTIGDIAFVRTDVLYNDVKFQVVGPVTREKIKSRGTFFGQSAGNQNIRSCALVRNNL